MSAKKSLTTNGWFDQIDKLFHPLTKITDGRVSHFSDAFILCCQREGMMEKILVSSFGKVLFAPKGNCRLSIEFRSTTDISPNFEIDG
jgi:hypothetical protein